MQIREPFIGSVSRIASAHIPHHVSLLRRCRGQRQRLFRAIAASGRGGSDTKWYYEKERRETRDGGGWW